MGTAGWKAIIRFSSDRHFTCRSGTGCPRVGLVGERGLYRVMVQLETSLSISDEGPHLDLTDWKHCTTDWYTAHETEAGQFVLPEFDQIDTDCFPDYSEEALRAEVLRVGGPAWLEVLDLPYYDDYSPLYESLSEVRIRIERHEPQGWTPVARMRVVVAMGC